MKVFAAVDVRAGSAVQLVGGRPDVERVRIPDPGVVARGWVDAGFRALHVVDLDAALGLGENGSAIADIAAAVAGRALLQVGGGLRDEPAVRAIFDLGADRVVVGTRGVEDRRWLETIAEKWPRRIVLAADIRAGAILSRGWTESTGVDAAPFLASLDSLPLAAVLVTDVDREGRQEGADLQRFRQLVAATGHPLIAAGGISSPADLVALAEAGAEGAVLGMALYTGRIHPDDALALETP